MLPSATQEPATHTAAPTPPSPAAPWFIAGTPFARWSDLARSLHPEASGLSAWLDALGVSETDGVSAEPGTLPAVPLGGNDVRAGWMLEMLAARLPQARFLLFVDSPEVAVARWLDLHPGSDARPALQAWCGLAQRILRHVHGFAPRSLVLDAEEAAREPGALAHAVSARLGLKVPTPAARPLWQADPLSLALGVGLVRETRLAQTLFEKLRATCLPLAEPETPPTTIDHLAAARQLGTLRHEVTRSQSALASNQETLARLQGEWQASHERHEVALRDALQQRDALDRQAAALRADLAAATAASSAAGAAAAAAATAAARAADAALRQQRQAQKAAAQALAERTAERDAARAQGDLLVRQLQAVRDEMAQHFAARNAASSGAQGEGGAALSVGVLRIGAASSAAPHHHLAFDLHQVQAADRLIDHLTLRLVEHHGRPGLVLLAPAGAPRPLAAWVTTGQEAGVDMMALLPTDDPSRQRLEMLATGDWQFVVGLAAVLHGALRGQDPEAVRWRRVAARLRRQLAQMPARLRYGRSDIRDAGTEGLRVTFGDVMFGGDRLADLQLLWRLDPGAVTGTRDMRLLAPDAADAAPPLVSWSVGADGAPVDHMRVPVGSALKAADKRRQWASMPVHDRELLLAVLDALPGAADQARQPDLPTGVGPSALVPAARALHRDARRALQRLQAGALVRTALRRLRRA